MSIKILKPIEHIRQRPSMYIGNISTPTHLLIELIDNAIDELLNSKGTKLQVIIDKTKDGYQYTVYDNGRGIPIKQKNLKKDIPIILATELFSGGKFDNSLYEVRAGLHGIGLTVINALSDFMTIKVGPKKASVAYTYLFEDGQFITKTKTEKDGWSTVITFKPSTKYFETDVVEINKIIEKLYVVKTILPHIEIVLIDNGKPIAIKHSLIEEMFKDDYIHFSFAHKQYTLNLYITIDQSTTTKQIKSIVNGLVVNDGTHIQLFEKLLKQNLLKRAPNNYVKPSDLLLSTKSLLILTIPETLSFSSQTKDKLVTPQSKLEPILNNRVIKKLISQNEVFFKRVIEIAHKYRLATITKTLKIRRAKAVLDESLKDCTIDDISQRELFLLEGESAGGTLQRVRNVKYHAILPLRGKVINAAEHSHNKLLTNSVVQRLVKVIGIKPFTDDLSALRYDKIIILTDADDDGKHITTLLLTLFYVICPALIKSGHLYLIEPPLYGAYKQKQFIPIYDVNELHKFKSFTRFKGLGEMQPNEIYQIALSKQRRLTKVTFTQPINIAKLWQKMKTVKPTQFTERR